VCLRSQERNTSAALQHAIATPTIKLKIHRPRVSTRTALATTQKVAFRKRFHLKFTTERNLSATGSGVEGLVQELSLDPANPPLRGLSRAFVVNSLEESQSELVTELSEVLAAKLRLGSVLRVLDVTTKREVLVAGNGEVLDGELIENLVAFILRLTDKSREGLVSVQSQVDEESVSASHGLEVTEEHVGSEVVQGLIDDVLRLRVGLGGSRALNLSLDGQNAQAANRASLDVVVLRTVGRHCDNEIRISIPRTTTNNYLFFNTKS